MSKGVELNQPKLIAMLCLPSIKFNIRIHAIFQVTTGLVA